MPFSRGFFSKFRHALFDKCQFLSLFVNIWSILYQYLSIVVNVRTYLLYSTAYCTVLRTYLPYWCYIETHNIYCSKYIFPTHVYIYIFTIYIYLANIYIYILMLYISEYYIQLYTFDIFRHICISCLSHF